jgi:hypothetical protein
LSFLRPSMIPFDSSIWQCCSFGMMVSMYPHLLLSFLRPSMILDKLKIWNIIKRSHANRIYISFQIS